MLDELVHPWKLSDLKMMPFPERRAPTAGAIDSILARFQATLKRRSTATLARLGPFLERIERHATQLQDMDETDYALISDEVRRQFLHTGLTAENIARSFALVRETSYRLLGMRHHPVQLVAGYMLLQGRLAEMNTGEGKTLTALLPAATAALAGVPVHIVTVNDYLAKRDADHLKPVYDRLGVSVGLVEHGQDPATRRAAYACDVVYCTNKELAFDYLRDTIALRGKRSKARVLLDQTIGDIRDRPQLYLRGLHFAIVDEADSVLVDEARTPLIISRELEDPVGAETYRAALDVAKDLQAADHYRLSTRDKTIHLTPLGRKIVADASSPAGGLWAARRARLELVEQALSALHLFKRDVHYIVVDGKVQIVDEYTGRVMADRSWERGLHQLIETKEDCKPSGRRETLAQITYQRFFRRYLWLAGMTGTAAEIATELDEVYDLKFIRIPTHRPVRREDLGARLCVTTGEKWRHVARRVREVSESGRPVLIGTRSVEASEALSVVLGAQGLQHTVLNARQDAGEAAIVTAAGSAGSVTVATNMAGRGTDIKLSPDVVKRGGLHVILTEYHESGRIDRQLFGRCARQGDPGSFEAIVSLEDELFRRYESHILPFSTIRPFNAFLCHVMRRFGQYMMERNHLWIRRQSVKQDTKLDTALAFAGKTD
ncbi:DEAD/DEAH box helicase [Rhizobium ruizarguesonis]|uniref:Protein translocase subunit SecA n=1 Tax=Rhizobium ruizarguesonis TaxID=2081791 RepID=A0AB38HU93_9HYPH|nr:DEAD/DEAH box helicase [Rhizobium ruizarguesonis]TBA13866.1 hypothetical protein ELH61_28105 [Rhizobium ruizarguesonis]TBB58497.1 hypothetical protein ELH42_30215 [Rhizobium ruizarguesonis]TBB60440.1 hypothetical protein ELH45_34490 [Rhizobium ruizarguesonis]TBB83497.1 hypothetical protein ELH39_32045 [Rhizobium ruizarguesonis]TBC04668.1 hypothetical protein ELH40_34880 [Rhizobium ruizarguesonis]